MSISNESNWGVAGVDEGEKKWRINVVRSLIWDVRLSCDEDTIGEMKESQFREMGMGKELRHIHRNITSFLQNE